MKKLNVNVIFFEIGLNLVLKVYLFNIFFDFVEDVLLFMKNRFEIVIFQKLFIELFCKGFFVIWENVVLICYNNFLIL